MYGLSMLCDILCDSILSHSEVVLPCAMPKLPCDSGLSLDVTILIVPYIYLQCTVIVSVHVYT